MESEEQRIAIAEVCGWKRTKDGFAWYVPGQGYANDPLGSLPDYLNDLNAMHEAEKIFKGSKLENAYRGYLWNICGRSEDYVSATASQHAEAFLRTLGLWKE